MKIADGEHEEGKEIILLSSAFIFVALRTSMLHVLFSLPVSVDDVFEKKKNGFSAMLWLPEKAMFLSTSFVCGVIKQEQDHGEPGVA
ncbi:MAG: hypothetical protein Q9166_000977 [cf. Caloplaca sp. 2 TL-2023]